MSFGIVFKGPEGIVLAADSRVTLTAQMKSPTEEGQSMLLPATYDNATKLLSVRGQQYVGAVTYGLGALGQRDFRTAHSLIPEFEHELEGAKRLSVQEFAEKLSDFFSRQWKLRMPVDSKGPDMIFIVGGYDEGAPYGRVFIFQIPSLPKPEERSVDYFAPTWGGQKEIADRLILGFDESLPIAMKDSLKLTKEQANLLAEKLRNQLMLPIPYPFLSLQDCVNLAIFLVRTTITLQSWMVGVRGVGGAIDVATITRNEGFKPIQQKIIVGERLA